MSLIASAAISRRWLGEAVAVIAGGPSLVAADVERAVGRCRLIAVNDAWRLAPSAELLYAADAAWWNHHRGVREFAGEKWTQDQPQAAQAAAAELWHLTVMPSRAQRGISFDPAAIHQGGSSGFQALNLAVHAGAARILLLGFDCEKGPDGRSHWFGAHPEPLERFKPFAMWRDAFEAAAPELAAAGVEVINCSRRTALTCFRRAPIEEVL